MMGTAAGLVAEGRRLKLVFAYRASLARDVFSAEHLALLGHACDILDPDPLETFGTDGAMALLAQADVLVTGWGCPRIDAQILARAPNLRMIAHAAGTVKSFLGPEVFGSDIAVSNAADANAIPVAEFTLAAILFANKNVLGFRELYSRQRDKIEPSHLTDTDFGNWQKTVGIVGMSRIGRRVVELLKPFDLRVIVYDPHLALDGAATAGVEAMELDALIASSDVLSLHAPAIDSTKNMIDARRLALLRDGATLINTARGSLVDHAALQRELVSGRISAVIDVTLPEVLPADSPLYDLPNVFLTPHIAGAIGKERLRLGELAVAEVLRFSRGEALAHRVSVETLHLQA